MEERTIRTMPIVTTLSFVRAVEDKTVTKTRGVRVTLTCYNYREYDSCQKPLTKKDVADAVSAVDVSPDTKCDAVHDAVRVDQRSRKNHKQGCATGGEGKGYC